MRKSESWVCKASAFTVAQLQMMNDANMWPFIASICFHMCVCVMRKCCCELSLLLLDVFIEFYDFRSFLGWDSPNIFHFPFEFERVIQTLYVNIQKHRKKNLIMFFLRMKKRKRKKAAMKRAFLNSNVLCKWHKFPPFQLDRQQFSSINSFIWYSKKKRTQMARRLLCKKRNRPFSSRRFSLKWSTYRKSFEILVRSWLTTFSFYHRPKSQCV